MIHSPPSSSTLLRLSLVCPSALLGRRPPPLPMAAAKLGVAGRVPVGEATRELPGPAPYTEPGRARREGERPFEGRGDEERGGGPEPTNLRWVRVREKMAWEREDWAFMSVSLVRRIEEPLRRRLGVH